MSCKLKVALLFYLSFVESFVVEDGMMNTIDENASNEEVSVIFDVANPTQAFDGVYLECFLHLSYSCIQEKTLKYLEELNKLSEVSVIGDYVKFVKINQTNDESEKVNDVTSNKSEDLSLSIDRAVDDFFNNHVLKFNALGRDVSVPDSVEEFVGRKRKGGGGGGGGGGGHGGDDGGKKKMMMMAMMCMKMKLMAMVPAMMGMMGMMSFKGMMFSMMSFMVSKMMLLMKILEKKGGGGGGGGGDGGWAAGGGGGGGAWMPAGGQDYGGGGGGGGGGGYDANGQWQSRSIIDVNNEAISAPIREPNYEPAKEREPIVSYVTPRVRHTKVLNEKKPFSSIKKLNDEIIKMNQGAVKSRKKRSIMDLLQNSYLYLTNQLLGMKRSTRIYPKYPNYRIINGVRYVYFPIRSIVKAPRELNPHPVPTATEETPIITAEDFNKGEILEGAVESRSIKLKKMKKFKDDVETVVEENPWE